MQQNSKRFISIYFSTTSFHHYNVSSSNMVTQEGDLVLLTLFVKATKIKAIGIVVNIKNVIYSYILF